MQSLRMTRPIRSSRVSQHFGEAKACIDPNTRRIYGKPFGVCISPQIDFYTEWLRMDGHNGMDMPGIVGENVCHAATFDGWMKTEKDNAGGLGVDVISNEKLFFAGPIPSYLKRKVTKHVHHGVTGFTAHVKLRYWHLHAYVGHDGKKVEYGQPIGLLGNTGASSGPHVHWAWKFCDENGVTLNKSNSFNGAEDPETNDYGVKYNHSIFAYDDAAFLKPNNTPELTEDERKDLVAQLSLLTRLLLQLRELVARL